MHVINFSYFSRIQSCLPQTSQMQTKYLFPLIYNIFFDENQGNIDELDGNEVPDSEMIEKVSITFLILCKMSKRLQLSTAKT